MNRELAALLPLLIEVSNSLLDLSGDSRTAGVSIGQFLISPIFAGAAALRGLAGTLKDFAIKGGFAGILSGAVDFRKNLQEEMAKAGEILLGPFPEPPSHPTRQKREAPIIDEAAQSKALDAARVLADAQLALQKDQLDNQVALAKASNAAQAAIEQDRFKAGLTNLQDFLGKRRAALESEAEKEIAIAEQQVTAIQDRLLEAETRPMKKGEAQAEREAELLKIGVDLEKARTEVEIRRIALTGQRAQLEGEEREAVRQFNQDELNAEAQLAQAQGQRFAAARIELQPQVAGIKRLAGETDAAFAQRQEMLREAGEAQIRVDEVQSQAQQTLSELESSRL